MTLSVTKNTMERGVCVENDLGEILMITKSSNFLYLILTIEIDLSMVKKIVNSRHQIIKYIKDV